MPLTPSQKDALIRFAEANPDLLDTLLSCDPENITIQADVDACDDPAAEAWVRENYRACARLRRALKQTVEA